MSMYKKVFWLIWFLSTILLVLILFNFQNIELIFFLVIFALIGNQMYEQKYYHKKVEKIYDLIKKIDIDPVLKGLNRFEKEQNEIKKDILELRQELENYKIEQENKYRDVVRKVIQLENQLNKKFKTLGEAVLNLSKENED